MLLLSDDSIMGIVGSTYSVYTIAAIPQITEAGVPYIAGGSSSGITDEGSDYVWMVRPTDVYQGQVLADVAIEVLGMQNPAIMYSTQSSLMALQERLVAALQERGIEVDPGNLYGFPEEEQNYAPIFAQIQNSDADGLICPLLSSASSLRSPASTCPIWARLLTAAPFAARTPAAPLMAGTPLPTGPRK